MASSPSERPDEGEGFADVARFDASENALMGAKAGKRRRGKASIVERLERRIRTLRLIATEYQFRPMYFFIPSHHAARCTEKFSAPERSPSFGIMPQVTLHSRAELTLGTMVNTALTTHHSPSNLGDLRTRTKAF